MFIQAQAELQDYWDVSRESQDLATSIVLVNLSLCKPIGNSIGKNKCSAQKQYFVCHGIFIVLTDDLSPGGESCCSWAMLKELIAAALELFNWWEVKFQSNIHGVFVYW